LGDVHGTTSPIIALRVCNSLRSFPRKRESRLGPRFRGDERKRVRNASHQTRSLLNVGDTPLP
jgi:hypothetical protein